MADSDAIELERVLGNDDAGLDVVAAIIARCDPDAPSSSGIVAAFDRLAESIPAADPSTVVRSVFGTLGFTGNIGRYYHPANSLIHKVLERRMGNPLSLAIVATEVSRRVGGTLRVVGFPGHVLIGDDDHPTRWFDPFLGGDPMDLAGCRSLLARMRPGEAFHPAMVRPSTGVEVASRILNNLDVAYRRTGEMSRLVKVLELRLGIPGAGHGERRQLAHTLIAAGRPFQAAAVLDDLAEADPSNAADYRDIRHRLLARKN